MIQLVVIVGAYNSIIMRILGFLFYFKSFFSPIPYDFYLCSDDKKKKNPTGKKDGIVRMVIILNKGRCRSSDFAVVGSERRW